MDCAGLQYRAMELLTHRLALKASLGNILLVGQFEKLGGPITGANRSDRGSRLHIGSAMCGQASAGRVLIAS
jgi:hypothetical protein